MKNKNDQAPFVNCNSCNGVFPAYLQEKAVTGGLLGYIECPDCGTQFESFYLSAKGVELRELLSTLTKGDPKRKSVLKELVGHFKRRGEF